MNFKDTLLLVLKITLWIFGVGILAIGLYSSFKKPGKSFGTSILIIIRDIKSWLWNMRFMGLFLLKLVAATYVGCLFCLMFLNGNPNSHNNIFFYPFKIIAICWFIAPFLIFLFLATYILIEIILGINSNKTKPEGIFGRELLYVLFFWLPVFSILFKWNIFPWN